ncbi:hypothetical protein GOB93_14280 [Acetobacter musti]|uniref:Uncharacterized protein n=1 Tax=Acetobacter musti TaxID=864732 RepID=A0ABX0JS07_9PROT|nr:hypothetical protein [Acetobacter musti]NHN85800.1 hypothetical protein [Acetobacter musti]
MTTNIDLCNRALRRLGTQSTITSLTDGSVEADTCNDFYDDVLLGLLQNPQCAAYPNYTWEWCRAVASGTGAASTNPRWAYEYALPEGCVQVCEIIDPNIPQKRWKPQDRFFLPDIPYQTGTGTAGGTDIVPVIWCDLPTLSVMIVTNTLTIDQWPATFRRAFWLALSAEIGTTLGVAGNIVGSIAQEAETALAQACKADQRVEVMSTDYVPDWIMARGMPLHHHDPAVQSLESYPSGFIAGDASANSPTPSYLTPAESLNGVAANGLTPRDIANRRGKYIPADTPDSRIGVLAIGMSPVGWRRPYHRRVNPVELPGFILDEGILDVDSLN